MLTFEQLGPGVAVKLQCMCGVCEPIAWQVVRKEIGTVLFYSTAHPVVFRGRRRADGGITDDRGARIEMSAKGLWG